MRRLRFAALSAVLVLTSVFWSVVPASAQQVKPEVTYYLSLGDSLARGVQPDENHVNAITNNGYPDQLYATLLKSDSSLKLIELGCPGESTLSMRDATKAFPDCQAGIYEQYGGAKTQLDAAIWVLQHHPGTVKYLTIDLGANDIVDCLQPTGVDQKCLADGVKQISTNLPSVLKSLRETLRDSGQRNVKTAGMTYYDPGLAYWFFNHQLAKDTVGYLTLVNGVLVAKYFQTGFRVAPVAAAFNTYDFSQKAGAAAPANVTQICALTFMCPPGAYSNIHATTNGYGVIADAFAKVLRW